MARALIRLVLALLAFQAMDVPSLANLLATGSGTHGCTEECPSDAPSKGDCSSQCPACPCAPHGAPLMGPSALPVLAAPVSAPSAPSLPEPPHSEAHARSIFHPPTPR